MAGNEDFFPFPFFLMSCVIVLCNVILYLKTILVENYCDLPKINKEASVNGT